MGLTVKDLQKMPCVECGDSVEHCVLVLSPACHKGAGTFVKFHKLTNSLEIVCAECKTRVVTIDISPTN